MSTARRRPSYNYGFDAGSNANHGHPDTLYPPEGYCLLERDVHRATTSLQVASFPFLSKLNLRTAINLSAEPLHDKAVDFFRSSGVAVLSPRSLEAFDGPHDLWEEAAKESLELLLDADNQPMLLLDSSSECEVAWLIGCLRRLQHWSICAIHDEYHMLTMKSTSYDTNQQFIERFDLDLVTLTSNLPSWFQEHLAMLEAEHNAEEELSERDAQRCRTAWTRGFSSSGEQRSPATAVASRPSSISDDVDAPVTPATTRKTEDDPPPPSLPSPLSEEISASSDVQSDLQKLDVAEDPERVNGESIRLRGVEDGILRKVPARKESGDRVPFPAERGGVTEVVPDYRLNAFVYLCPLVSEGCKFTAKAWLQDEDD